MLMLKSEKLGELKLKRITSVRTILIYTALVAQIHQNRLLMQTIQLKIVQPLVHHKYKSYEKVSGYVLLLVVNLQTFILIDQYLVNLHYVYYTGRSSIQNKTFHRMSTENKQYFLQLFLWTYLVQGLIHIFNFSWNTPVCRRRHQVSNLIYICLVGSSRLRRTQSWFVNNPINLFVITHYF